METITVSSNGNVTQYLQDSIDASGDVVEVIFDTDRCDLFGLVINDKRFVKITSTSPVEVSIPEGDYDQTDLNSNVIRFVNCDKVISDARITIDGSRASFKRDDDKRSGPSIAVIGNGKLVDFSNLTNLDNGYGGLYVKAMDIYSPGYDLVKISDFRSENSPLNIIECRDGHRSIIIRGVHAEDPNMKSVYSAGSADATIRITAEVNNPDNYVEFVKISEVYSRYSTSGIFVQQACEHQVIEDVLIVDRGYDGDGNDPAINFPGPSSKIDNVYWYGPTSARYSRYRTVNSNVKKGVLSLWIGQAGDQNITVSDCDFDADVRFAGANTIRPGQEGWSRLGVLRDSIIRGNVNGNGFGRIENCRFMGPTITDPVVKTSQHDDFEKSFGPLSLGLGMFKPCQVINCDFYAKDIYLYGSHDYVIENPKFYGGSRVVATNKYSGNCLITTPTDIDFVGSYSTADVAGSVTIDRPIGEVKIGVNSNGPGGEVTVTEIHRLPPDVCQ